MGVSTFGKRRTFFNSSVINVNGILNIAPHASFRNIADPADSPINGPVMLFFDDIFC